MTYSTESTSKIELRECDKCKESLRIVHENVHLGHDEVVRAVAYEIASGKRHVCWNLPEDANLLVLDD